MHSGLTVSPWANTANPAANTFCAALTSRSWSVAHPGQDQRRRCNGNWVKTCPQWLQRLLEGYQRSMRTNSRPVPRALYSSCLTSSTHPASPMDLAKQRFFRMADTDELSKAITWFSWINRVDSWCRKSLRVSAIFACSLATFSFVLARRAELRCFLARRRCSFASLASCCRKTAGALIFSPVESVAK